MTQFEERAGYYLHPNHVTAPDASNDFVIEVRKTTHDRYIDKLAAAIATPKGGRIAENLDVVDLVEHVAGTRYFAIPDARAGFAIRADGELTGVFSTSPGLGDTLVRVAVWRGAKRLDCFDGHLSALYARHGFVEVRREANWTPGGPDVVFMEFA